MFDSRIGVRWSLASIFILFLHDYCLASFCGNNKIPYGIEIYRNLQPVFLCSKPNCFDKNFAECDERATRTVCRSKDGWVGGIDKSYGKNMPLYVQCCEFEGFDKLSEPVHTDVPIRPGEYFEGDEVQGKDGDEVIAFDIVTNISLVHGKDNDIHYKISVRRFRCADLERTKIYKPWSWP